MFITCIVVGLLAVLSILPGLYYREYYLHEKKKTKHIQVLLTQKKSFIGMTICQLAVGGCMIALVIWHKLAWDIALREQLVLHLLAGQAVNVQENVAMLVGMCLYTGLNYLGQRFFAFKNVEREKIHP